MHHSKWSYTNNRLIKHYFKIYYIIYKYIFIWYLSICSIFAHPNFQRFLYKHSEKLKIKHKLNLNTITSCLLHYIAENVYMYDCQISSLSVTPTRAQFPVLSCTLLCRSLIHEFTKEGWWHCDIFLTVWCYFYVSRNVCTRRTLQRTNIHARGPAGWEQEGWWFRSVGCTWAVIFVGLCVFGSP